MYAYFHLHIIPKRCLHFRPNVGTASFCSTPRLTLAQLQALLGHSSSNTSTSTSKSAGPQQQHQQLRVKCVARSDLAAVAA